MKSSFWRKAFTLFILLSLFIGVSSGKPATAERAAKDGQITSSEIHAGNASFSLSLTDEILPPQYMALERASQSGAHDQIFNVPYQVRDIRMGSEPSNPISLSKVGDHLYFQADDGANGIEFWKSDGTQAGTAMVKDIHASTAGSSPSELIFMNRLVLFAASDGNYGIELWKSDGTDTGTIMVKDTFPTGNTVNIFLTPLNDKLHFTAYDEINGAELWESDGSPSGTRAVMDIYPGGNSSTPYWLTRVGGRIFFSANDGSSGAEIWAVTVPLVAEDDSAIVLEDSETTIAVLDNDLSVTNSALSLWSLGTPEHGSVTTDGFKITYKPATDFTGVDRFDYMVADAQENLGRAIVKVRVVPVVVRFRVHLPLLLR